MFLHMCVILFTGGSPGSPPCTGRTPPDLAGRTPPDQADPPPGPDRENPPWTWQGEPPQDLAGRTPPGPGRETPQDLAGRTPPTPPRWEEDCIIRSMSGRYASYWNAFLFYKGKELNENYQRNFWKIIIIAISKLS